jgi:peptidoglycan/xylan/chitin deacetylase (PgdA/CDA1 family)
VTARTLICVVALLALLGFVAARAEEAASSTISVPRTGAVRVPILMYHQIRDLPHEPDRSAFTSSVEPAEFACQLDYLSSHNFHTIALDQLEHHLRTNQPLPPNPIVLTFDDGWSSALFAAEQLKKRNMVGTFFVCPNLLTSGPGQRYLSWSDVQRLAETGMSIQSHTLTHPHLTTLTDSTLIHELTDSRERLQQAISRPVTALAYPFGEFDARTAIAAEAAGYTCAVSTDPRTSHARADLMHLGRINIDYFMTLTDFARRIDPGLR